MIDLLFKHLGEGRRQGRKPIFFFFYWKALCQRQQPHMHASASIYAFPPHQVAKHATKTSRKNKLRIHATTSDSSVPHQAEARRKRPRLRRPGHLNSECSKQKQNNLHKSPESWKPRTQRAACRGRRNSKVLGEARMLEDVPDRVTHLQHRVTRNKAVASSQATRMPGDPQVRVTRSHEEQGSDQHPRWGYFSSPRSPTCTPDM